VVGSAGDVAAGVEWGAGRFSNGAYIEQNNEVVTYPVGDFDPSQGSLEMWVKPFWAGSPDETIRTLFDLEGTSPTQDSLKLYRKRELGVGYLVLEYYGDNQFNFTLKASIDDWTANSWHHVVAAWDIDPCMRMYLFIDGILAANMTSRSIYVTPIASLGDNYYLGNDDGGTEPFNGVIDEFRVSNITRSVIDDFYITITPSIADLQISPIGEGGFIQRTTLNVSEARVMQVGAVLDDVLSTNTVYANVTLYTCGSVVS